ncbi:MAG: hypothetical protein ACPLYD_12070 [Anaerolineae bacterium]
MALCNYLAWDKTVQTLDGVLSVASRPAFCVAPECLGHPMRLLSAEGHQIAPPNSTYGYDVLARIGWLRQERRDTYAEIRADLAERVQISESHVRYLYERVYLPALACHERQYWACLEQTARQHGGLIIALDRLAPDSLPDIMAVEPNGGTLALTKSCQPEQFAAYLSHCVYFGHSRLAVNRQAQHGEAPVGGSKSPRGFAL